MPLDNLAFPLGSWLDATDQDGNDHSAALVGLEFEATFPAENTAGSMAVGLKDAARIRVRVVKNGSGGSLTAKKAVRYSTTDGEWGQVVAGHANAAYQKDVHLVDPLVGSVPDGKLFYVVVGGVTIAKTHTTLANAISVGDRLATENGGGLVKAVLPGTPSAQDAFDRAQATIAVAMEARTTSQTDTDTLVYVLRHT